MNFTIDTRELEALRQRFAAFSDRRFESALAETLNGVARDVRDVWGGQLQVKVDRPAQPTRNAPVISRRADVGRLVAEISLRTEISGGPGAIPPSEYLATLERGAAGRRQKKFELALQRAGAMPSGHKVVPGKYARLDGFGNMARSQIVQVLNQLAGGAVQRGYRQVISAKASVRAASARRAGRSYVAVTSAKGGVAPGVYQRTDKGLLPVMFYVTRTRYRKLLNLDESAQRTVAQSLSPRLGVAMQRRVQSLLARGGA